MRYTQVEAQGKTFVYDRSEVASYTAKKLSSQGHKVTLKGIYVDDETGKEFTELTVTYCPPTRRTTMKAYIVIIHETGAPEEEWTPLLASHDHDFATEQAKKVSSLIDAFDDIVPGGSPYDAVRAIEVPLEVIERIKQEYEDKRETRLTLQ